MSGTISIGVAGAGVFGGHHAGKYAGMTTARLAGIYDIDPDRAARSASAFSTRAFDDYAALVSAVDAVVIATPATTHYALALAALEARRHVFVEKPLAMRAEEAEALVALAEKQGLVLQVGHQERYVAAAIGLLDHVARPVRIDCVRRAAPSDRCRDVSVVFDLMIHDFDLVRQLTNDAPAKVTAEGGHDEARAELVLENGTVATFSASRAADDLRRTMRLVYERGFIEIDFLQRSVVNTTDASLSGDFDAVRGGMALTDPLGLGAGKFVAAIADGAAFGPAASGQPEASGQAYVSGRDGADAVSWACAVESAVFSNGSSKSPGGSANGATSTEERVRA